MDNILTMERVYFIVNNCQEGYDNKNLVIFYISEKKYGQGFSSVMYERQERRTALSVSILIKVDIFLLLESNAS